MTTERQQVLHLWLSSSALDSTVLGWAFFDGAEGAGPTPAVDPPYATGVSALVDGWHLLQVSQLIPAYPGSERETSFLKHEFVFTRLVSLPDL
jgi:hypothetical protein